MLTINASGIESIKEDELEVWEVLQLRNLSLLPFVDIDKNSFLLVSGSHWDGEWWTHFFTTNATGGWYSLRRICGVLYYDYYCYYYYCCYCL